MALISRLAVSDYLNRPLRDSATAKGLSDKALDHRLSELLPRPRFHTAPRTHQKVCFLLGLKYPRYIHLLDMGLGKTWVALNLAAYRITCRTVERVLVLVPNTTNIQDWLEQVRTHAPHLTAAGLDGGPEARLEVLDSPAQIVISTYAGWLATVCGREKKRKGKGNRMVVDKRLAKIHGSRFQMMVLDELNAVANPQSVTHRACCHLAKHCPYRAGLTGTPFGRDPAAVWGQFKVIDGGDTFGEMGLFRSGYFKAVKNFWTGFDEWKFNPASKPLFSRALRHRSIRYREAECLDLPAMVESTRKVIWPEETWQYYAKLVEDLRKAKGNFRVMENAFIRMRQISSGFLTVKDPTDERHTIVFKDNPKADAVMQWLKEIPPDRKAIIFHDFRTSGELVAKRLKLEKFKHVRILGGQAKRNAQAFDDFRGKDSVRVLLCSTAGAKGLNLQVANYVGFYEIPPSPLLWQQMTKRAHRQGQTRVVFTTYFAVKNSVEEKILAFCREGRDLLAALVDGRESLKSLLRG